MSKSAPDTTTKYICLEDSEAGTQRHSEAQKHKNARGGVKNRHTPKKNVWEEGKKLPHPKEKEKL